MKTERKWLGHLPGSFNDQLISRLYLDVNGERAIYILKTYCNTHLRMSTEDSSALMVFVGLSQRQHEQFNRAVFYYTGLRILALRNAGYRLRRLHAEHKHTAMTRTVVDMSRFAGEGRVHIA